MLILFCFYLCYVRVKILFRGAPQVAFPHQYIHGNEEEVLLLKDDVKNPKGQQQHQVVASKLRRQVVVRHLSCFQSPKPGYSVHPGLTCPPEASLEQCWHLIATNPSAKPLVHLYSILLGMIKEEKTSFFHCSKSVNLKSCIHPAVTNLIMTIQAT